MKKSTEPAPRTAELLRETSESRIELSLNLDGTGIARVDTTVPFFDHMLTALTKHSLIDLELTARGDTEIDVHHTVEDTGIALGTAILQALGTKEGISRYGDALVPLDDWDSQVAAFVDAGYVLAASLNTSAPAVYFDCRDDLGCFVELYGRTERSAGFFAHLRSLHETWDGTDPVRARTAAPSSPPTPEAS